MVAWGRRWVAVEFSRPCNLPRGQALVYETEYVNGSSTEFAWCRVCRPITKADVRQRVGRPADSVGASSFLEFESDVCFPRAEHPCEFPMDVDDELTLRADPPDFKLVLVVGRTHVVGTA